eukprot:SAG11_NODE_31193_length_294_cov_0.400000_1_plen_40_part_01
MAIKNAALSTDETLVSGPFDVAPRHYSIIERPSAAAVDKT